MLCTYCTLTLNLDLINSPLCNSKAAVVELGSVNRALTFDRPDGPGLTLRIWQKVRGPENIRRKILPTKGGASARRSRGRRGLTWWKFGLSPHFVRTSRVFQSVGCRAFGCVVPRGLRNTLSWSLGSIVPSGRRRNEVQGTARVRPTNTTKEGIVPPISRL